MADGQEKPKFILPKGARLVSDIKRNPAEAQARLEAAKAAAKPKISDGMKSCLPCAERKRLRSIGINPDELVSCLMTTYNRGPELKHLVEESIESFLRQDYPNKELLICNDTPGQKLIFKHPQVRIFNLEERLPTLSDKIIYMINRAYGKFLCRWDDDDICLPHRLSLSHAKIGNNLEWRAANHWYDTGMLSETKHPGNSHIHALWRRDVLHRIGGYPPKRSGDEDQAFNNALKDAGIDSGGELLKPEDIYYIYRWNTGSKHLSGRGGNLQENYDLIGKRTVWHGELVLEPKWRMHYPALVRQTIRAEFNREATSWTTISGYCNYHNYYVDVVNRMPPRGRLVEIGCLHGTSLVHLAHLAKCADRRLRVYGVDLGFGVEPTGDDYSVTPTLLNNLRRAGVNDIVTLLAGESTRSADTFEDNSLDFVFIDAAHDYQSVKTDIQVWWPKVKKGGILAGHDYAHQDYPGVKNAVDEFFGGPKPAKNNPDVWEVVK